MEDLDFYRQSTLPHIHREKHSLIDIPKTIGPYKIDSLLHKGSMSLLFLANRGGSNAPLAIKILSPDLLSNQEMVDQFLEEARIIGLTDHPNIVKLYGQGEWDRGLYIAMEFIQGISLKQFLMGRSLSLRRSLDIILQTAYALLHLHTHGVIHRDVKPENILIQENGQVKVIDFGIAQVTEDRIQNKRGGGIIGTPSYMSPEQRKNPRSVSFNTDIYSLGVIAYELILGKLSFGTIQLELLPKHLGLIIQKALLPNPSERYQDMVELITDISTYLRDNLLEEDRSDEDQSKEVLESMGEQQQKLLPKTLPSWSDLEVGLAKSKGAYLFGVYYDFFRLPDYSFVIIVAESPLKGVSSVTSIATLRGLIRSLIHPYLNESKSIPFVTARFAEKLNQVVYDEPNHEHEALMILHLHPLLNELSFVSSGFASIAHLNRNGGAPRMLYNHSPFIGETPNITYGSTNDSWNPGDLLVLHTLSSPKIPKVDRKKIDDATLQTMRALAPSFSNNYAQELLDRLKPLTPDNAEKIAIVLTRL